MPIHTDYDMQLSRSSSLDKSALDWGNIRLFNQNTTCVFIHFLVARTVISTRIWVSDFKVAYFTKKFQ